MVAELPASGYSQSMSTPSSPADVTKFTTLLTNVVRVPELAASVSNAESFPSFQPPMEMETLTPLLCAAVMSDFIRVSPLLNPDSPPWAVGRMNA